MLRINLLPPYIYDKQQKIRLAIVWGLGVAAVVVAFIFWYNSLNNTLQVDEDKRKEAERQEVAFKGLTSKIADVDAKIDFTNQKLTFVKNANTYVAAWPALLNMMRDLTSNKVILDSIKLEANHKTLDMTGFATNEVDVVRWWMLLRNNSQKFDRVFFALPPHPYPPIPAAGSGGFGSSGSMGMSGGSPGMMGMSGGSPGMMGTASRPMGSGGSMGMSGGSPGMMGMSGGSPGMMGQSGGGGGGGPVGPAVLGTIHGINFTAAVDLKTPFADGMPVPSWPPNGAAAPAAGTIGMGGMGAGRPGRGPRMGGSRGPG